MQHSAAPRRNPPAGVARKSSRGVEEVEVNSEKLYLASLEQDNVVEDLGIFASPELAAVAHDLFACKLAYDAGHGSLDGATPDTNYPLLAYSWQRVFWNSLKQHNSSRLAVVIKCKGLTEQLYHGPSWKKDQAAQQQGRAVGPTAVQPPWQHGTASTKGAAAPGAANPSEGVPARQRTTSSTGSEQSLPRPASLGQVAEGQQPVASATGRPALPRSQLGQPRQDREQPAPAQQQQQEQQGQPGQQLKQAAQKQGSQPAKLRDGVKSSQPGPKQVKPGQTSGSIPAAAQEPATKLKAQSSSPRPKVPKRVPPPPALQHGQQQQQQQPQQQQQQEQEQGGTPLAAVEAGDSEPPAAKRLKTSAEPSGLPAASMGQQPAGQGAAGGAKQVAKEKQAAAAASAAAGAPQSKLVPKLEAGQGRPEQQQQQQQQQELEQKAEPESRAAWGSPVLVPSFLLSEAEPTKPGVGLGQADDMALDEPAAASAAAGTGTGTAAEADGGEQEELEVDENGKHPAPAVSLAKDSSSGEEEDGDSEGEEEEEDIVEDWSTSSGDDVPLSTKAASAGAAGAAIRSLPKGDGRPAAASKKPEALPKAVAAAQPAQRVAVLPTVSSEEDDKDVPPAARPSGRPAGKAAAAAAVPSSPARLKGAAGSGAAPAAAAGARAGVAAKPEALAGRPAKRKAPEESDAQAGPSVNNRPPTGQPAAGAGEEPRNVWLNSVEWPKGSGKCPILVKSTQLKQKWFTLTAKAVDMICPDADPDLKDGDFILEDEVTHKTHTVRFWVKLLPRQPKAAAKDAANDNPPLSGRQCYFTKLAQFVQRTGIKPGDVLWFKQHQGGGAGERNRALFGIWRQDSQEAREFTEALRDGKGKRAKRKLV